MAGAPCIGLGVMCEKSHGELPLAGVVYNEEGERYTGEGRHWSVACGGNIWLDDNARLADGGRGLSSAVVEYALVMWRGGSIYIEPAREFGLCSVLGWFCATTGEMRGYQFCSFEALVTMRDGRRSSLIFIVWMSSSCSGKVCCECWPPLRRSLEEL